MSKWTTADIPDQNGRVAVITGANTGLGYETALALAAHGAHVVLAVRNLDKGKDAISRITSQSPQADVALQELDLTSLESTRAAAEQLRADHDRIDLLVNNAGVMYPPKETTKDGFELQFGTNHLGHFAFTGLLLDRILPVAGSRVVTVSSMGHRIRADIHFDDLQFEHSYNRVKAYGQAKLANLLFTYELQRRLAAHGTHDRRRRPPRRLEHRLDAPPSGLGRRRLTPCSRPSPRTRRWARCHNCGPPPTRPWLAGSTTAPPVSPRRSGYPKVVGSSKKSHDVDRQRKLWTVSEELTGVDATPVPSRITKSSSCS